MRAAGNTIAGSSGQNIGGGGGGGGPTDPYNASAYYNFGTTDTQTYYLPLNSIFETLFIFDERASFPSIHAGELLNVVVRTTGDPGTVTIGLHLAQNVTPVQTLALVVSPATPTVFDFSALAGRFITKNVAVSVSYQASLATSGNTQVQAEYRWAP